MNTIPASAPWFNTLQGLIFARRFPMLFHYAFVGLLLAHAASAHSAVFWVSNTLDSGQGSLRNAIQNANDSAGGHVVFTNVTGELILQSSLPPIARNLTIVGPGTNQFVLNANYYRAFQIDPGSRASISSLVIANARRIGSTNNGGAILNLGALSISNCVLTNSSAVGGWGGAIYNSGTLRVMNSIFISNSVTGETGKGSRIDGGGGGGSGGFGGAIFTEVGGLTVQNCQFIGNTATGGTGGPGAGVNGVGVGDGSGGKGGGINGGFGGGIVNGGFPAGNGGFGGGGGGSGWNGGGLFVGGIGGFGGGGGGGAFMGVGGAGGIGGGQGASGGDINPRGGNGGGGAGIGGAIFVASGTSRLLANTFSGNRVVPGTGGIPVVERVGRVGEGIEPNLYNFAGQVSIPQLTITTNGGGFVSLNPPGGPTYLDARVEVSATPSSGWTLLQWFGDVTGTNLTNAAYVDVDKAVSAVFGTQITTNVVGLGSIAISPNASWYPYGQKVTFSPQPDAGARFKQWTVGASAYTNLILELPIASANLSITAEFESLPANHYALSAVVEGGGSISINPAQKSHSAGSIVTLTANPGVDQEFLGWSGALVSTQLAVQTTMDQSKTVRALFTTRPLITSVYSVADALGTTSLRFFATSGLGQPYVVEYSTNLVDWTQSAVLTNAFGIIQFDAPPVQPSNQHRFYRIAQ